MNREELAWAAGFFDGEGCTYSTISENRVVVGVMVSQASRDLLDRFREAVGFGKVYGPYKNNGSFSKGPKYSWSAPGLERVQALVAMLWFKLGAVKKQQAAAVLTRYKLNPPAIRGRYRSQ